MSQRFDRAEILWVAMTASSTLDPSVMSTEDLRSTMRVSGGLTMNR